MYGKIFKSENMMTGNIGSANEINETPCLPTTGILCFMR